MPFVTEELWQRLPKPSGSVADSIMLAAFPQRQESWQDKGVESAMEFLLEVVKATRGLRSGQYICPTSLSLRPACP